VLANNIVIQCYGNREVFLECSFLLLTLSRNLHQNPSPFQVHIYTDNPEWFLSFADCPLPLFFHEINPDILRHWRGKIDFVHRVKIEALLNFCAAYGGNILYLDTDMCALQPIDDIWQQLQLGRSFMHINEGKVGERGNTMLGKLAKFIEASDNIQIKGKKLEECYMWNAGVIGFNSSARPLIDQVKQFTDAVYPDFRKHIVEQFAFSVFFQKSGNLRAAFPYFVHYWGLKEMRRVLADFFTFHHGADWVTLKQNAGAIQPYELAIAKMQYYQHRPVWDKITRKKWQPNLPKWGRVSQELT
jgi:hypothetical protein